MVSIKALIAVALSLIVLSDAALIEKEYSQNSVDKLSVLRQLGGTGPFVEASGYGIPTSTPYQCTIDQAHLFMRHGERFPTSGTGKNLKTLINKLNNSTASAVGPLAFAKDYEYFVKSTKFYEQETFLGAYAGTSEAFHLGTTLRERYDHLVNSSNTLPIFTSGQKRVFDTAANFADGFTFGDRVTNYTMVVLPETQDYGLNSLTNTDSCINFNGNQEGPAANLSLTYRQVEAARLNTLSPGFNISTDDVFNMCNYCAFELDAVGSSKFCDAVSMEAMIGFAYEKDVDYYYGDGPGYNMSYVTGSAYGNATATLLKDNSTDTGNLFFSFAHDTDLMRYVTALGLFDKDQPLPVDHIEFNRFFLSSEIVPMGARLITERLSCYNETSKSDDKYVRLLLNDQVVPYPNCTSGPGYSCPLDTYLDIIESKTFDFVTECNMNSSTPQYLSFYWDWEDNKYPTTYDK